MSQNKWRTFFDFSDLVFVFTTIVLIVVTSQLPFKPEQKGDNNFHEETRNFINIIYGEETWDTLYVKKAVGPNIYYFIPYLIAGAKKDDDTYWLHAIFWNFIFMIATTLLVKKSVEMLFDKKTAILAGILFFAFPIHLYYAFGINGESLVIFSTSLLLYGGIGWQNQLSKFYKSRYWWAFLIGAVLLMLSRFNFILFVPLVLLFAGYLFYVKEKKDLRLGLVVFSMVMLVVGIGIRVGLDNLPATKGKNYQSSYGTYVLHLGRFQFREEPGDWRFWDDKYRQGSKDYNNWNKNETELNAAITEQYPFHKVYNHWIITDYLSHPFGTIKQFFVKLAFGHVFKINSIKAGDFKLGPLKGKTGHLIFHILLNFINIIIFIGFIGFIWKERAFLIDRYWLFALMILSFLVFYSLTYMEPRYLFPLRIIYLIGASKFVLDLYSRKKRKLEEIN